MGTNAIKYVLTLYIQVNRHLVAAIGVRRDAEISSTVFPISTDESQGADSTLCRVLLFQRVSVVGQLLLQLRPVLFPKYF